MNNIAVAHFRPHGYQAEHLNFEHTNMTRQKYFTNNTNNNHVSPCFPVLQCYIYTILHKINNICTDVRGM